MVSEKFDPSKARATILYVAERLRRQSIEKRADLYKTLKTIYFAERRHLAEYGRSITNDFYVAMDHGPVPYKIYEFIRLVRGDTYFRDHPDKEKLSRLFRVENKIDIVPLQQADEDEFSESDIECLEKAIKKTLPLSFSELKKISHDSAFNHAREIEEENLSFEDMAKAEKDNPDMIEIIKLNLENESFVH